MFGHDFCLSPVNIDSLSDDLQDRLDEIIELNEEIKKKTIFEWIINLGWLNKVGVKADNTIQTVYSFFHATFQEYFAAKVIDDWDYFVPKEHTNFPIPNKKYRIFETQWKQVILFWVGRETINSKEKEALIAKLFNFDDGLFFRIYDYFDSNYSLHSLVIAGFCTSEFDSQLNNIICHTLIERFFEKQYFFYKKIIYSLNRHVVIDIFLTYIKKSILNCYTNTFDLALFMFKKIANDDEYQIYIDFVNDVLQNTFNFQLDSNIVLEYYLSIYPCNDIKSLIFESLVGTAQNLSTSQVNRINAIKLLAWIDIDRIDVKASIEIIKDVSVGELTRTLIIECLSWLESVDEAAISTLIGIIYDNSTDRSVLVLRKAVECLGKVGKKNSIAVEALRSVIHNTLIEDCIRMDAARSLCQLRQNNQTAIAVLISIAYNSYVEQSTRIQAIQYIGKIEGLEEAAISTLISILYDNSTDSPVRREVAECLVNVGENNQIAIEALIDVIQDIFVEDYIRMDVVISLGKVEKDNKKIIFVLKNIIYDRTADKLIRRNAVKSLGQIGKKNSIAVEALIDIIQNSSPQKFILIAAVKCLGHIKINDEVIATLISIFKNTSIDKYTRNKAIEILAQFTKEDKEIIWALSSLVRDPFTTEYIQKQTVQILIKIYVDRKYIPLIDILCDNSVAKHIHTKLIKIPTQINEKEKVTWTLINIYKDKYAAEITRERVLRLFNCMNLTNLDNLIPLYGLFNNVAITRNTLERIIEILTILKEGEDKSAMMLMINIIKDTSIHYSIHLHILRSFKWMKVKNKLVCMTLIGIIENTSNEILRFEAVATLASIGSKDRIVVKTLLDFIDKKPLYIDRRYEALKILGQIGIENKHIIKTLVNRVEYYTGNLPIYESIPYDCETYINTIEKITEGKYDQFYEAFYPKIRLDDFTKIIKESIKPFQNRIRLVYVNESKIVDCKNPVLDIYKQMVKQGCPRIQNTPKTLSDLSWYWELDVAEPERLPVLICYEENTESNNSNFSTDFLDALSRFDGAICVISNATTTQTLKHFYPNQPNLVDNIIDWIQHTFLNEA